MATPEEIRARIEEANARVLDIFTKGKMILTDIRPAVEVVPGMTDNMILLPGPPSELDTIAYPLRISACGAAVHEGLAKDLDEAWEKIKAGEIILDAAQNHDCSNAACQSTSAHMPVFVVEDPVYGGSGYCVPHPGPVNPTLRWGQYDESVEANLTWIEEVLSPVLKEAVLLSGGIDLISILSQTAGMGDENHNRQPASSMKFALTMIPYIMKGSNPHKEEVIEWLAANDRFYLQVLMAGIGALTHSAKQVKDSTVMVGMGANGVKFGIQIAATGNAWYTTEAPVVQGTLLSPKTKPEDVAGYLGDSCVTEVWGLGGMSAIAGPSYVRLTGSTYSAAVDRTARARAVSLGEHSFDPVPWDDFKGSPVGIDIRKVIGMNVVPVSHGGSGLKTGGQAGAGACDLPLDCFKNALEGFAATVL